MELTFPINLIGLNDDASGGEVLTRHGEYLGVWRFIEDETNETGVLQFIVVGEVEPLFSEKVPFLDSGMLRGLAASNLCRAIRDWHDEQK